MDVYGRCRYESNIIHSDVSIVGFFMVDVDMNPT